MWTDPYIAYDREGHIGTLIYDAKGKYTAACSCNWKDGPHDNTLRAIEALNKHLTTDTTTKPNEVNDTMKCTNCGHVVSETYENPTEVRKRERRYALLGAAAILTGGTLAQVGDPDIEFFIGLAEDMLKEIERRET